MPSLTDDNIRYLLTLPPAEIIRWYLAKGYTFSWRWQDTWQSAHTRAFTVAKVMKLDILQDIKNEVDKIFTEGISEEQFIRNLEWTLKRKGWWGKVRADQVPGYDPASGTPPDKIVQLGSPRRLKTIYNVNANVAYSAGNYKSNIAVTSYFPYWQYNQIDRPSMRKSHHPFDKKVFRWDDPIWDIIYPPSDWNCGCYISPLTEEQIKSRGLKVENGNDFVALAKKNIPEEWQYNPAKEYATWQPDLSKYDDDLRNAFNGS